MVNEGLPPLVGDRSSVLILGSFPSEESLRCREYYANRGNQFWRLMGALFGAHLELSYRRRCDVLQERQVAIWDVLHTCERDGSLDDAIIGRTAVINDVPAFLAVHPSVQMIGLNGKTAANYFSKRFPSLGSPHLQIVALPSSSSAHAAMTFDKKVQAWSILQDFARV